mmetsp:Transcript_10523/g.30779  ORF Transcript_10523/g.30779 Transcript_10523/m.30779 type:complete len:273 (-) Transcript_10523:257-1075(-)
MKRDSISRFERNQPIQDGLAVQCHAAYGFQAYRHETRSDYIRLDRTSRSQTITLPSASIHPQCLLFGHSYFSSNHFERRSAVDQRRPCKARVALWALPGILRVEGGRNRCGLLLGAWLHLNLTLFLCLCSMLSMPSLFLHLHLLGDALSIIGGRPVLAVAVAAGSILRRDGVQIRTRTRISIRFRIRRTRQNSDTVVADPFDVTLDEVALGSVLLFVAEQSLSTGVAIDADGLVVVHNAPRLFGFRQEQQRRCRMERALALVFVLVAVPVHI